MNAPPPNNEVTRRGFFQLTLGWLAGACAVGATAAAAVRFLVPNVLYEPSQRFKVGRPEDYADGSVTFMEDERVFLVRKGNAFRCLSAVCTHLGCTVNRGGQGFHCPCHGSAFDDEGSVKSGPAPRGLDWFAVTMSRDNRLVVDKGLRVGAEKCLLV